MITFYTHQHDIVAGKETHAPGRKGFIFNTPDKNIKTWSFETTKDLRTEIDKLKGIPSTEVTLCELNLIDTMERVFYRHC